MRSCAVRDDQTAAVHYIFNSVYLQLHFLKESCGIRGGNAVESLWIGCGKTVENMIFQDTFQPFSAISGQNRGLFRRFRKSFARFPAENRTERAESPGTVTKITTRNSKRFRKSFLLFFKN